MKWYIVHTLNFISVVLLVLYFHYIVIILLSSVFLRFIHVDSVATCFVSAPVWYCPGVLRTSFVDRLHRLFLIFDSYTCCKRERFSLFPCLGFSGMLSFSLIFTLWSSLTQCSSLQSDETNAVYFVLSSSPPCFSTLGNTAGGKPGGLEKPPVQMWPSAFQVAVWFAQAVSCSACCVSCSHAGYKIASWY